MKEGRRPRRPAAAIIAGQGTAAEDAGPPYVAFNEGISRGAAGGDASLIVVALSWGCYTTRIPYARHLVLTWLFPD
jgi:hypothetical protein